MYSDYAQQTRSTPFVVSSINGTDRYMINRDSYCSPTRNRFAFTTTVWRLLKRFVDNLCFRNAHADNATLWISFEPIVKTTDVRLTSLSMTTKVVEHVTIVRDDGRPTKHWLWKEDTPCFVNAHDLRYILGMFADRRRRRRPRRRRPRRGEQQHGNVTFLFRCRRTTTVCASSERNEIYETKLHYVCTNCLSAGTFKSYKTV